MPNPNFWAHICQPLLIVQIPLRPQPTTIQLKRFSHWKLPSLNPGPVILKFLNFQKMTISSICFGVDTQMSPKHAAWNFSQSPKRQFEKFFRAYFSKKSFDFVPLLQILIVETAKKCPWTRLFSIFSLMILNKKSLVIFIKNKSIILILVGKCAYNSIVFFTYVAIVTAGEKEFFTWDNPSIKLSICHHSLHRLFHRSFHEGHFIWKRLVEMKNTDCFACLEILKFQECLLFVPNTDSCRS